ncbi:MAG TPA: Ada metal-binding domain-containing protein [Chitinophagaceae bacterium]|nr:Ada metal-binding domain-containing protein [Chitinophagaceae bacterium]
MIPHSSISSRRLKGLIKNGSITMAGNVQLKIYGTLHCTSGKRMRQKSRVFFSGEAEAVKAGYRPCGHCMRQQYLLWKKQLK